MKQPDLQVVERSTSSLIPYARNSRTHSDKQISQLMASIKEWGWTTPILIAEDDTVIAGHGRLIAAQRLGLKKVPCIVASGWTPTQIKAYVIADNRIAENAGWDLELLAIEIEDIRLDGMSIDLIGFDEAALEELFGKEAGDDATEKPLKDEGIDYQEKYAVIIECKDEDEQAEIYERLVGEGLICKVLVN